MPRTAGSDELYWFAVVTVTVEVTALIPPPVNSRRSLTRRAVLADPSRNVSPLTAGFPCRIADECDLARGNR
jgi:hypothetical protein